MQDLLVEDPLFEHEGTCWFCEKTSDDLRKCISCEVLVCSEDWIELPNNLGFYCFNCNEGVEGPWEGWDKS